MAVPSVNPRLCNRKDLTAAGTWDECGAQAEWQIGLDMFGTLVYSGEQPTHMRLDIFVCDRHSASLAWTDLVTNEMMQQINNALVINGAPPRDFARSVVRFFPRAEWMNMEAPHA